MARYEFLCPDGHLTEITQPMADTVPEQVACADGPCDQPAARVWEPPAAIHYKGRGFYSTDVKGAQERRRRKNPGDDLPVGHDPVAAAIARSL